MNENFNELHLKNFGLLYRTPDAQISPSPVYDVVCTAIYPDLDRELALKMNTPGTSSSALSTPSTQPSNN